MGQAKQKIYLETSVISAYFDFKKQDIQRKKMTRIFWKKVLPKYEPTVSELVAFELSQITNHKRKKLLLGQIAGIAQFAITKDIEKLAQKYT